MLASDTPRPTRALLTLLRLLVNAQHEPDVDTCDATVLVQLAESAELLQRISSWASLQRGNCWQPANWIKVRSKLSGGDQHSYHRSR
jgi:hypothetical protein